MTSSSALLALFPPELLPRVLALLDGWSLCQLYRAHCYSPRLPDLAPLFTLVFKQRFAPRDAWPVLDLALDEPDPELLADDAVGAAARGCPAVRVPCVAEALECAADFRAELPRAAAVELIVVRDGDELPCDEIASLDVKALEVTVNTPAEIGAVAELAADADQLHRLAFDVQLDPGAYPLPAHFSPLMRCTRLVSLKIHLGDSQSAAHVLGALAEAVGRAETRPPLTQLVVSADFLPRAHSSDSNAPSPPALKDSLSRILAGFPQLADLAIRGLVDVGKDAYSEIVAKSSFLESLALLPGKENGPNLATAVLAAHPLKMRRLGCSAHRVFEAGAKQLAVRLAESQITHLAFTNGNIAGGGAAAIVAALDAASLVSLDLSNVAMGDEGAQAVEKLLRAAKALRELNMSKNLITAAGARAIASALGENNKTLREIDMSENDIGDDGAAALFTSLLKDPRAPLTAIDFSETGLGDGAAAVVASLIAASAPQTRIQRLSLARTGVTDAGAQCLADSLQHAAPRSMVALSLRGTRVKDAAVLARLRRFAWPQ